MGAGQRRRAHKPSRRAWGRRRRRRRFRRQLLLPLHRERHHALHRRLHVWLQPAHQAGKACGVAVLDAVQRLCRQAGWVDE